MKLELKIAFGLCVLVLLAAVLACGSEGGPTDPPDTPVPAPPTAGSPAAQPTATATAVPPTEAPVRPTATVATVPAAPSTATVPAPTNTPRPEGGPSAPLPTQVPLLKPVEIPPDHPAAPLALLPANSLIYTHINLVTVSDRPGLREHVEFQLGHFVSGDELPFAEELLGTAGARALTLSIPFEGYEWVCILQGDLLMVAAALTSAADSGTGLSASRIETFAGTDIYSLVRTRSSGRQSEIFIAILDSETLAASPDLPALIDVIARGERALELPHTLSAMIEDWGFGDFLQVVNTGFFGLGATAQGTPLDRQRMFGFHASLSGESTTILRALQQYDDEELAAAAAEWLQEQAEPRWRNIGWGASATIDQWQHRGSTVYGEVTVPDEDMPALVQGN